MKPQKKLKIIEQAGKSLKKSSPTILTAISAVGVIATAILVAKETPKAMKRIEDASKRKQNDTNEPLTKIEIIKNGFPCYIPAVIVGSATIMCIFSVNMLNKRQQASLVSAYTLLNRSYHDYREKVKELYGEEAHRAVLKAMSEETVDKTHAVYAPNMFANTTLEFGVPEEEHLFYDSYGQRHFVSTIGKVLQAEYHLNRNFALRGDATINEFYELLGIAPIKDGDQIGWWVDDDMEMYWIDFNHFISDLDDGPDRPPVQCLVIDYPQLPGIPSEDYT